MSEEEMEAQVQQEATKEILWKFVQEEKLHQLPKSMLQSSMLRQIKAGREYPQFGYEQSKTIVRLNEINALARMKDRGGAFSG